MNAVPRRVFEGLFQRAYGEEIRQRWFPFMDDLPEMPD